MILIYSSKITNRLKYAFRLIFTDILGVEVKFTIDPDEFKSFDGPKIVYDNHSQGNELFFQSKAILFDSDIKDYSINVFEWEDLKVIFPSGRLSALPFDPFAASFYFATRYEEYLPHIKDHFERFDAKESLAFQKGFLQKPMVNIYAEKVKQVVLQRFPGFAFPEKKYSFIPTIDVDNAFAYKEKGIVRTVGAYAKDIINLDFNNLLTRTNVLLGRQQDPYDTYEYQLALQKKYNLKPIYFFLLADYGVNDKNVPVQSRELQSLIKSLADYAEIGIHPGFNSYKNLKKLSQEHQRLEKILNREISKSRQHYLRLTIPETYRNLIELDIINDYTMGYASQIGFRAGICCAYHFYDLDMDVETPLVIHPFAVMDATLKFYMKVRPETAIDYIKPLVNEIKAVNGTFISLWHNESLSNEKEWKGWRMVYEELIEYANP
jgi:hypothetical protein